MSVRCSSSSAAVKPGRKPFAEPAGREAACAAGEETRPRGPYTYRRGIMALAAEKALEHIGETHGVADHDHDLMGY